VLWLAHRLALRSHRPPLVGAWARLSRLVARAAGALVTRGEPDASVYARGGIGRGDFVPGLSDIDVVVVVANDPAGAGRASERVRRAWHRAARRAPGLARAFGEPRVVDDAELADLVATSAFTYGLGPARRTRAAYLPDASLADRLRVLERPGLYGVTDDWRLLAGRERRPAEPARDEDERRVAAWLELQFYWRLVFPALLDPDGPRTPFLCVKLISEPARIWLWLAHGERAGTRRDALERTLRRLPEEEHAARLAVGLERSLHARPQPPVEDALAALARFSERIAALVVAGATARGSTAVRLVGAESPAGTARPLCDWRALVVGGSGDEVVVPAPGAVDDRRALHDATLAQDGRTYRSLRSERLIVLPAAVRERVRLRAVSCEATDPVSFALEAGRDEAWFPDARGWSVGDIARRGVAEHRARLAPGGSAGDGAAALVTLLTAARAALVLAGVERGEPVIPVTLAATGGLLGERSASARPVADDAVAALTEHAERGTQPAEATVTRLRRLVTGLDAYRGG
jgi:hypothetical protein